MVGSPPGRMRFWCVSGFAVLPAGVVLMHWFVFAQAEPTLTLSLPLGVNRSLILVAAPRSLDTAREPPVPRIHELRLSIGNEDRVQDSYRQVLDLTLPLWPVYSLVRD